MSATEIIAILALVAWSIYRQTRKTEVTADGRFKMAIIYAIVGVCVGGFDRPAGLAGYGMIVIGLALSLVVGLARGRLTRMWTDAIWAMVNVWGSGIDKNPSLTGWKGKY